MNKKLHTPAKCFVKFSKCDNDSLIKLFCFHHAGGAASIFRPWIKDLPEKIELYSLQLPGRQNRINEPPHKDLSKLIKETSEAILPYLDHKPFAFFGHSMGALLCYELTRYLYNHYNLLPEKIFVSAFRAPHLPLNKVKVHNLLQKDFLEELRVLNGTPDELLNNIELMNIFGPTIRADFQVCETYIYKVDKPLRCPIIACGGLDDKQVSLNELRHWEQHSGSNFKIHMFNGDHFYIKSMQKQLLDLIGAELL